MNNNIFVELKNVAMKLAGKSDTYSKKIYRLAQTLENQKNLYNNFDPSQETPNDMIENFESQNVAPFSNNNEADVTIPIESFVKPKESEVPVGDYEIHHCSVVFNAPRDIKESDMMNYILGIGEQLGVEVKKFEWEKEDPKQKSSK